MIVDLNQGTDEWHRFRATRIGASEASIIMGTNPWKTPHQLWEQKVGYSPPTKRTSAMQRGIDLEEKARNCFFMTHNLYVKPMVFVHPEYPFLMASLDGMSEDLQTAVEIKCNGKENHELALREMIPPYYEAQVQHQMFVCELNYMYYYSFDGELGTCITVIRNDAFIKEMLKKELEFYECMQELTPPPMTSKDYTKIEDAAFQEEIRQWRLVKAQLRELEKIEEHYRNKLIKKAEGKNCLGGGVRISKSIRKGSVDYKKIPQLIGVDLEKHRKEPTIYWTITETKGENE